MSRKQFRTGDDGERIPLASACVDCGGSDVYSLDRCHACYMREYRKRRTVSAQTVTERVKIEGKPPVQEKAHKAGKAPKAEEFESVNYAALSMRRNI